MAARHFRLLVFDDKHDILFAIDLVAGNAAVAIWRARIELNKRHRANLYELWQCERPTQAAVNTPTWHLSASEDKPALRRRSR